MLNLSYANRLPWRNGSAPLHGITSLSPIRVCLRTFECWCCRFCVIDSTTSFKYCPACLPSDLQSLPAKWATFIFISGFWSCPPLPSIVQIAPRLKWNYYGSASRQTSSSSISSTLTSSAILDNNKVRIKFKSDLLQIKLHKILEWGNLHDSAYGILDILLAIDGSMIWDSSFNPTFSIIMVMISIASSRFFST